MLKPFYQCNQCSKPIEIEGNTTAFVGVINVHPQLGIVQDLSILPIELCSNLLAIRFHWCDEKCTKEAAGEYYKTVRGDREKIAAMEQARKAGTLEAPKEAAPKIILPS